MYKSHLGRRNFDESLPTRVALSWLREVSLNCPAYSSSLSGLVGVANLKMTIKDPSGNVVGSSDKRNLAVVSFVPLVTGTYTIEVMYQGGNANSITYYGIAWW